MFEDAGAAPTTHSTYTWPNSTVHVYTPNHTAQTDFTPPSTKPPSTLVRTHPANMQCSQAGRGVTYNRGLAPPPQIPWVSCMCPGLSGDEKTGRGTVNDGGHRRWSCREWRHAASLRRPGGGRACCSVARADPLGLPGWNMCCECVSSKPQQCLHHLLTAHGLPGSLSGTTCNSYNHKAPRRPPPGTSSRRASNPRIHHRSLPG